MALSRLSFTKLGKDAHNTSQCPVAPPVVVRVESTQALTLTIAPSSTEPPTSAPSHEGSWQEPVQHLDAGKRPPCEELLRQRIYNHAPLQRTGLWAEGVIEDTIITKTHQQNTTLFMFSDLLLMRQGRKPNVPPKFFKSKGSIHLIRNPFDSIYSWFQYRQTGEHFMTAEDFNVDQWETHVVRELEEWRRDTHYWMHAQDTDPDYKMMIVRYEDLHNDTEGLLRRMLDFIEWQNPDEYRIECALNVTQCSKMTYNCRSGKANLASLNAYSNAQRKWVLQELKPYLEFYGYPTTLPMDSKHDYVVGLRLPGTNFPVFCRASSTFEKGVNEIRARAAVVQNETKLYEKPLILLWNFPLYPQWHKQGTFTHLWNQVELKKPPSKCDWTSQRELLADSSAVLFAGLPHMTEHTRDWCNKEYSAPRKKFYGQKWGVFDYESGIVYPLLLNSNWYTLFDWHMGWRNQSDLRVGQKCPFPTSRGYQDPPPPKEPGKIVSYIASRCDADDRDEMVRWLIDYVPISSLGKCVQNAEIEGDTPGSNPRKIDLKLTYMEITTKWCASEIGKYKFYLAWETANETDFVTDKIYHAWIAGTVPVYMGANNIDDYVPGDKSVIKVADFPNLEALGKFLVELDQNDAEYQTYFAWKEKPLRPEFTKYDELCVLHAGERFCDMVIDAQKKARDAFEQDPNRPLHQTPEEITVEEEERNAKTTSEKSKNTKTHKARKDLPQAPHDDNPAAPHDLPIEVDDEVIATSAPKKTEHELQYKRDQMRTQSKEERDATLPPQPHAANDRPAHATAFDEPDVAAVVPVKKTHENPDEDDEASDVPNVPLDAPVDVGEHWQSPPADGDDVGHRAAPAAIDQDAEHRHAHALEQVDDHPYIGKDDDPQAAANDASEPVPENKKSRSTGTSTLQSAVRKSGSAETLRTTSATVTTTTKAKRPSN